MVNMCTFQLLLVSRRRRFLLDRRPNRCQLELPHPKCNCIVLIGTAKPNIWAIRCCVLPVSLPAHVLRTICSSTGVAAGGRGAARCMSRQHQLLLSHRHTQPAASMDSKQLLPEPSAAQVGRNMQQSGPFSRSYELPNAHACKCIRCDDMCVCTAEDTT
jgi:hypothetical protein